MKLFSWFSLKTTKVWMVKLRAGNRFHSHRSTDSSGEKHMSVSLFQSVWMWDKARWITVRWACASVSLSSRPSMNTLHYVRHTQPVGKFTADKDSFQVMQEEPSPEDYWWPCLQQTHTHTVEVVQCYSEGQELTWNRYCSYSVCVCVCVCVCEIH